MKIIKKGKLTIDGEDSTISGYEFDCEGESMLGATIYMLEEGIRDLQAQIEKAKIEGVNISDGGNNQLNGKSWEFPMGVLAYPIPVAAQNVRWVDNYTEIPSLESGYDKALWLSQTDVHADK